MCSCARSIAIGCAERVPRPDEEGGFQFIIQAPARAEERRGRIGRFDLTMRAADIRAARNDGAGAPVISHRQPFPIRHERVLRPAQHRADVVRVMIGGIEIRVIANPRREQHRDIFLRMKGVSAQSGIVAQLRGFGREQALDYFPRLAPRGPA